MHGLVTGCAAYRQAGDAPLPAQCLGGLHQLPGHAPAAEYRLHIEILQLTNRSAGKGGEYLRHRAHAHSPAIPPGHQEGDSPLPDGLGQPLLLLLRQGFLSNVLAIAVFQLPKLPVCRVGQPLHGDGPVLPGRQQHQRHTPLIGPVGHKAQSAPEALPRRCGAVQLRVSGPLFPGPVQQRPGAGRAHSAAPVLRQHAELQNEAFAVLAGEHRRQGKAHILPVPGKRQPMDRMDRPGAKALHGPAVVVSQKIRPVLVLRVRENIPAEIGPKPLPEQGPFLLRDGLADDNVFYHVLFLHYIASNNAIYGRVSSCGPSPAARYDPS